MRKYTAFLSTLLFTLALSPGIMAQQTDAAAKVEPTARAAEPPTHFYRLDLVLEQVGGDGKPTNSRTYSTTVSTGRSDAGASMRTGARIPIEVGGSKGGGTSEWQYMDVGVSFDAYNARDVGGELSFSLAAEVSTVAASKDNAMTSRPTMDQNKWRGQVLIPVGKATTVFSSDELQSNDAMKLVVTATLLQ